MGTLATCLTTIVWNWFSKSSVFIDSMSLFCSRDPRELRDFFFLDGVVMVTWALDTLDIGNLAVNRLIGFKSDKSKEKIIYLKKKKFMQQRQFSM
jgi:hypothetical protein